MLTKNSRSDILGCLLLLSSSSCLTTGTPMSAFSLPANYSAAALPTAAANLSLTTITNNTGSTHPAAAALPTALTKPSLIPITNDTVSPHPPITNDTVSLHPPITNNTVPTHPDPAAAAGAGGPPPPKIKDLKIEDVGWKYGNIAIYNWCPDPLYLTSVGAHYIGEPRTDEKGWGTEEDMIYHTIPSHQSYHEPFRASAGCKYKGKPGYCPDEDKLAGQAVSIKISKTNNPADQNITQFEYALYQNPYTKDEFKRLYYDLSLLDCGVPARDDVTDASATQEDYAKKRAQCPGFAGGVAITLDGDPEGRSCPPIYCDGVQRCLMIYTFDRTRQKEASFTCDKEFKGVMRLDLCLDKAGNDSRLRAALDRAMSWQKTATHEVASLQRAQTMAQTAVTTPTPAPNQAHPTAALEPGVVSRPPVGR